MAGESARVTYKHFRLDAAKVRRVRAALRASTDANAIERALDLVLAESERNKLVAEAHQRFVESGITIRDVYGVAKTH